jgi:hypothetical protein
MIIIDRIYMNQLSLHVIYIWNVIEVHLHHVFIGYEFVMENSIVLMMDVMKNIVGKCKFNHLMKIILYLLIENV